MLWAPALQFGFLDAEVKRLLIQCVAAAITGAAATFSVAWYIQVMYSYKFTTVTDTGIPWSLPASDQGMILGVPVMPTQQRGQQRGWRHEGRGHGDLWVCAVHQNAPGFVVLQSYPLRPEDEAGLIAFYPWLATLPTPPPVPWTRAKQLDSRSWEEPPVNLIEVAAGWPLLAVRDFYERPDQNPRFHDGPAVPMPVIDQLSQWPRLPLGGPLDGARLAIIPIWSGFVINTLFFGSMAWLVWRSGIAAKRGVMSSIRRKKGLCPACGYPAVPSGPCPECGKGDPQDIRAYKHHGPRGRSRAVGWSME